MRIRSTKPEFWRSKTIAALPWDVRLVLKGLESYVDDNGVGKDDIALIAADVFPRDLSASPPETLARLTEAISRLSEGGLIVRYEFEGEDLVYIDKWKQLQRIDKPARGRFRRPDGTLEYSEDVNRETYRSPREDFRSPPEKVAPVTGEQGNRGTGDLGASLALRPAPTLAVAGNSQDLLGEWIDHCPEPPPGRVKGQVAKEIKTMLDEGIPYERVRSGLAEWNTRGLHPSVLPSVVHELGNRKNGVSRRQAETNGVFDRAMERARAKEAERG